MAWVNYDPAESQFEMTQSRNLSFLMDGVKENRMEKSFTRWTYTWVMWRKLFLCELPLKIRIPEKVLSMHVFIGGFLSTSYDRWKKWRIRRLQRALSKTEIERTATERNERQKALHVTESWVRAGRRRRGKFLILARARRKASFSWRDAALTRRSHSLT